MEKQASGIRSQDIVVLLKLFLIEDSEWRVGDMAKEIRLSQGEVSKALERLKRAALISFDKKRVLKGNALEFLLYGFRYVFPASPGALAKGMKTAHSGPFLSKKIRSKEHFVWPESGGKVKGESIAPLYSGATEAAKRDRELYELLTLLDALRVGRVRERKISADELSRRFKD